MAKRSRTEAQIAAEEAYAQSRVQISVRLTLDEVKRLDALRGTLTRAEFLKSRSLSSTGKGKR